MQEKTYSETRIKLENDETSCEQLVSSFLDRIYSGNDELNSILDIHADSAIERAKVLDGERTSGSYRSLTGMIVGVKDVICREGERVTCGSRMLEDFRSLYSATAVQRLEEEGAIIIAATNCDEFAMGSSNESSYFGPVVNPADSTRVSGGSSGGSAAAVAAGFCHSALGSDTGGSIRQPASFCGVVGLKPTYGRVSRYGLVAYASSFDCIGPFANSLDDAFAVLEAISGQDPRDATSMRAPSVRENEADARKTNKYRVGVPIEYMEDGLSEAARSVVQDAIKTLRAKDVQVVDVSLPMTEFGIAAYYVLVTAEASSNLARFDGVRYGYRAPAESLQELYEQSRTQGFGEEVKRRIMLGTYVLSSGYYDEYYGKAQRVRRLIQEDFQRAFEDVDVLLTPTTPSSAFQFGEKLDDPLQMYLTDVYTVSANLAGIPAVSIPAPVRDGGLPLGIQLMAPAFEERRLYDMGKLLETIETQ